MAFSAAVWTTGSLEDRILFFFLLPKSLRQLITGDLIADRTVMLQFWNEALSVVDVFFG